MHIKNYYFLLLFAITTYFISREMQSWMSSKQVVNFEFIGTAAAADTLLSSDAWQQPSGSNALNNTERMRINTQWDFAYIISYSLFFLFLARTALGNMHPHLKKMSLLLLFVALFDVVENVFLLQILDGARGSYPMMMAILAGAKFSGLIFFIGWLITNVVRKIVNKNG